MPLEQHHKIENKKIENKEFFLLFGGLRLIRNF
jgi:hypothetical protein